MGNFWYISPVKILTRNRASTGDIMLFKDFIEIIKSAEVVKDCFEHDPGNDALLKATIHFQCEL